MRTSVPRPQGFTAPKTAQSSHVSLVRMLHILVAAIAVVLCATIPSHAVTGDRVLDELSPETRQAIVVTAANWHASHATVTAYERSADGTWHEVIASTPARIGETGMIPAARRRQDTGKTPAGTFAITSAFGRKANPGTELPYVQLDRNDTWPYWRGDPATYNVLQTTALDTNGHGRFIEHLWRKGRQYDYVAVMDYNLPRGEITTGADGVRRAASPANTRKGGGIFLHVTNGKSTAGCIAVPEATMVRLLKWMNPQDHPVIITRVD